MQAGWSTAPQNIRALGFGAGMGGMRDTCGAVTGMFMVADMLYGYTDSQATTEKAAHYATIRKLAEQFREENQSLMCRDLLAFCKKAQQPMERTDAYYAERPCTRLVMDAARLLDNLIAERGLNK